MRTPTITNVPLHPPFYPDYGAPARGIALCWWFHGGDKAAGVVMVVGTELARVGGSVCSAVRWRLPVNVHSYLVGHINNLCQGIFFLFLCFLGQKKRLT